MTERKTRSEHHEEMIGRFLESQSTVIAMLLYGSEVRKLEKKFPILITKIEKHGDLYNCLAYKKSMNMK